MPEVTSITWQPSASLENLHLRAAILGKIRHFFSERCILEVETPLLSASTVTDLHLSSFATHYYSNATQKRKVYLQTSPEYAMKRLLASGTGSIYQICKAFRNHGEQGRRHNPEFTLLEWYRIDFTLAQLMDETNALLEIILGTPPAQRFSYSEVFNSCLHLDPHQTCPDILKNKALKLGLPIAKLPLNDTDSWLQLLLDHILNTTLNRPYPVFIYDFPASQAALARIRPGNPPIAERAELFIKGLELANAFQELTDPIEQEKRFSADIKKRQKELKPIITPDKYLLSALKHGLPECSGIALGLDRLILLAAQAQSLGEVLSFDFQHA